MSTTEFAYAVKSGDKTYGVQSREILLSLVQHGKIPREAAVYDYSGKTWRRAGQMEELRAAFSALASGPNLQVKVAPQAATGPQTKVATGPQAKAAAPNSVERRSSLKITNFNVGPEKTSDSSTQLPTLAAAATTAFPKVGGSSTQIPIVNVGNVGPQVPREAAEAEKAVPAYELESPIGSLCDEDETEEDDIFDRPLYRRMATQKIMIKTARRPDEEIDPNDPFGLAAVLEDESLRAKWAESTAKNKKNSESGAIKTTSASGAVSRVIATGAGKQAGEAAGSGGQLAGSIQLMEAVMAAAARQEAERKAEAHGKTWETTTAKIVTALIPTLEVPKFPRSTRVALFVFTFFTAAVLGLLAGKTAYEPMPGVHVISAIVTHESSSPHGSN